MQGKHHVQESEIDQTKNQSSYKQSREARKQNQSAEKVAKESRLTFY